MKENVSKEYIESEYHLAMLDLRTAKNEEEQWKARKTMARLEAIAIPTYGEEFLNEIREKEGIETKRQNHRPPKERIIESDALKKDYYTIYEVADLLGFHHQTIRKMIREGELPARKFGKEWRIRKADLEAFTQPSNT